MVCPLAVRREARGGELVTEETVSAMREPKSRIMPHASLPSSFAAAARRAWGTFAHAVTRRANEDEPVPRSGARGKVTFTQRAQ